MGDVGYVRADSQGIVLGECAVGRTTVRRQGLNGAAVRLNKTEEDRLQFLINGTGPVKGVCCCGGRGAIAIRNSTQGIINHLLR